ncbi:Histone acetyltransferase-like protein [Hapsidospora chrysogenum ATCC 11550]|uniref:histone acetyltransferase n=1 Tax=Hapsidospora chrysogenum (strain ATCC 11550 / CBS 779.69 / DSM 880 / IAM 14645 / JCM 23072 / IMI 49137) TaxID=857340 RepID=A0A086SYD4_HAPC1|nr:Histone acetyltransferase-like protein [Hapsidospora chrysogenum ATCC 11550]
MATAEAHQDDLQSRLAAVLPKDKQFHIYHLSTPPTKCDALCSPPPNERPDRTYCEKHFLAVSIDHHVPVEHDADKQVFVLGIEVLIFSTVHATTIFISKADSTGYLHLLGLAPGSRTPSPIREVCATFINFLIDKRRRKEIQLVVSLFARAQAQYLFPGSANNQGKHVLDDRGLVKWWCRVLDPLLSRRGLGTTDGYLVVPGHDAHETRAFLPRGASASGRWTPADHPLERISHYTREFDWVPPRCLIPRYPDDPKSRFRDELDEEASKTGHFRTTGGWKSVRTLETFWEMMAFRQECSSGRLTGFIWIVFDDEGKENVTGPDAASKQRPLDVAPETPRKQQRTFSNTTPTTTPRKLFPSGDSSNPTVDARTKPSSSKRKLAKEKTKKKKKKLSGIIIPRLPRIKTAQRNYLLDRPVHTAYYSWDPSGRGERVVREDDYRRMVELLLHLDFATLDKAAHSTRRWVTEVGAGSGSSWGRTVTGAREPQVAVQTEANVGGQQQQQQQQQQQVNNLTGLVKRKRTDSSTAAAEVNVLGAGLVRKKPKAVEEQAAESEVNVLGQGLVRKKPKP